MRMFNWLKDRVGPGIALALFLNLLIQIPVGIATYGIGFLISGFTELIYLGPIIAIVHVIGYEGIVKGMVTVAAGAFLFSGIGLAFYSLD